MLKQHQNGKHNLTMVFFSIDCNSLVPCRQPNQLSVVWTRRNRRLVTEPKKWEPTMKNPLKGLVVWTVPENKEASITLFGDPRSQDFEDKMWTFFIEDVRS